MAQGLDLNKPGFLEPLLSLPIRVNFTAIGTWNAGPSAPPNPKEGQAWMDTSISSNIKLNVFVLGAFVTILQNLTGGPPTQTGSEKVVHTEAAPALTWLITHNLGTVNVIPYFLDASDEGMFPNVFSIVNDNTVQATFLTPQQGRAIIIG
jgi:hypothetical protein